MSRPRARPPVRPCNRIRRESLRTDTPANPNTMRRRFLPPFGPSRRAAGRERPLPRSGDPGPRVGHGVAHVPAAYLRSCDGFCTRQCREQSTQDPIANAGKNSPRDPIRGRSSAPMTRSCRSRSGVTSLLLVALRSLGHRVVDFHAVLGGVNALRSASTSSVQKPA